MLANVVSNALSWQLEDRGKLAAISILSEIVNNLESFIVYRRVILFERQKISETLLIFCLIFLIVIYACTTPGCLFKILHLYFYPQKNKNIPFLGNNFLLKILEKGNLNSLRTFSSSCISQGRYYSLVLQSVYMVPLNLIRHAYNFLQNLISHTHNSFIFGINLTCND